MATLETRYLPADRLRALMVGATLPMTVSGSALFAGISGFTSITEKLRQSLGARRGAETLVSHLNRVYDALIAQVEGYSGSIISFAGDAITCWFTGDDAANRAVLCAIDAMNTIEHITLPDGETAAIGIKVSIATGMVQRFVVGDPDIQVIDVLAGATVVRMAAGESEAEGGEVLIDQPTEILLGGTIHVREWRVRDEERFAVIERVAASPIPPIISKSDTELDEAVLRPWLLPAVARQFQAGLGEYLTELRPAVALFMRFSGIDYDHDPEANTKLDRFTRLAQQILARYESNLLQLTMGDKGSYIYAAFGAPLAHEDDAARALNAALDLRVETADLGYLDPVQIGISRGTMRSGAYGGQTRRIYGVLGDEVNLAARLMTRADPGTILVSEALLDAKVNGFALEALPPIKVKGKSNPITVLRLTGRQEQSFVRRFYTTPLIGRNAELTALQTALQPIFAGRHVGVLYLYGEPGMGKSRLAYEAQTQLQAHASATWLTGGRQSFFNPCIDDACRIKRDAQREDRKRQLIDVKLS